MRSPDCPSCQRFVGPADICVYCGEQRLQTHRERRARLLVIPVAIAALAALTAFAAQGTLPEVEGDAITALMNHARVSITGTVRYAPQTRNTPVSSVYVTIASGDRLIRAKAYNATADALRPTVNSLKRRDHVRVSGSLSLAQGRDAVLYMDRLDPLDL